MSTHIVSLLITIGFIGISFIFMIIPSYITVIILVSIVAVSVYHEVYRELLIRKNRRK